MKLYMATTSPYVRKTLVVAHETGLSDRIERVELAIAPTAPVDDLNRLNPLGKVPCLVSDDGIALYDSRVIAEYLDTLHDGERLVPPEGVRRWDVLTRQALGDGVLDAGVGTRYETFLRPEEKRWADWIAAQKGKITRALDAMDAGIDAWPGKLDLGWITWAVALGYLDFRYAEDRWRDGRPRLAEWYAKMAERPSMKATEPA